MNYRNNILRLIYNRNGYLSYRWIKSHRSPRTPGTDRADRRNNGNGTGWGFIGHSKTLLLSPTNNFKTKKRSTMKPLTKITLTFLVLSIITEVYAIFNCWTLSNMFFNVNCKSIVIICIVIKLSNLKNNTREKDIQSNKN